jgi:hypothetical protein
MVSYAGEFGEVRSISYLSTHVWHWLFALEKNKARSHGCK